MTSSVDIMQLSLLLKQPGQDTQKSRRALQVYYSRIDLKYSLKTIPIIHAHLPQLQIFRKVNSEVYRESDLILCRKYDKVLGWMMIGLDNRRENVISAVLRLLRTISVMIFLTMGSLFFSNDANELILLPLENLMALVSSTS